MLVLGTAIVDPEANERPHRVKHLPERHDLATNVRWR